MMMVEFGKELARIVLPSAFNLSFEIFGPRLPASDTFSVLFARDGDNAVSLLDFYVQPSLDLGFAYRGFQFSANGMPKLRNNYQSAWTMVYMSYGNGKIALSTSDDPTLVYTYSLSDVGAPLSAHQMAIFYASDPDIQTAGGYIRNFVIEGERMHMSVTPSEAAVFLTNLCLL
jgi:hypothetical protein